MSELYGIYTKLVNIDWKLKALLCVMEMLEANEENEQIRFVVGVLRYYLGCLEGDLEKNMEQLDLYELKRNKENK